MSTCDIVEARDLSKRKNLRGSELVKAEGEELMKHVPEGSLLVALDETGTQFTSPDLRAGLNPNRIEGFAG